MAKFASVLVLVAACKFRTGDAPDAPMGSGSDAKMIDAAIDSAFDAPPDAPKEACLARWHDGTVHFGTPSELTALKVGANDDDPFITPDNLTIYFHAPGVGGDDTMIATRANPADAFGAPSVVTQLSTMNDDSKVSLTGDGLTAFLASTLSVGGHGGLDVWTATRATATDTFGALSETGLSSVETSDNEFDPAISFDGKHLYLAPVIGGTQHIAVSTKNNGTGNFSAPAQLTELADPNGAGEADPSPSHDESVIVFSALTTGTNIPAGRNMWFATRNGGSGAFSAPALVPDLDTDSDEGGPALSDDTCTLYFSSNRGNDGLRIWVATMD